MKSLFEQMGCTYLVVGDYILPNLTLPHQKQTFLGKYGRLRKTYLKEHKKGAYTSLVITGKLLDHLH
jgi:hypothetical protein